MRSFSSDLIAKIMPFIGIGIFLVIFIIALFLFSYVLLVGAIIGLILFVLAYIKQTFFNSGKKKSEIVTKHQSRTYDNDEFK